tara:strand:+ start:3087 stop:3221 length:135 start_codon:yes stop_codon:yes gene_type:complete
MKQGVRHLDKVLEEMNTFIRMHPEHEYLMDAWVSVLERIWRDAQ